MLDLIEPLRVTKNRFPDLLHGEGTCVLNRFDSLFSPAVALEAVLFCRLKRRREGTRGGFAPALIAFGALPSVVPLETN